MRNPSSSSQWSKWRRENESSGLILQFIYPPDDKIGVREKKKEGERDKMKKKEKWKQTLLSVFSSSLTYLVKDERIRWRRRSSCNRRRRIRNRSKCTYWRWFWWWRRCRKSRRWIGRYRRRFWRIIFKIYNKIQKLCFPNKFIWWHSFC